MSKANVKRTDKGAGSDMINHQRAMDESMNERLKSQPGDADVNQLNNEKNETHVRDVSEKKSGRAKH